MYKYETHLHTAPVSHCAKAGVEESLAFYKEMGYDGVFVTNHFLDGNMNRDHKAAPYEEAIRFYFSDYEKALEIGKKIGIKVFVGVELSYKGTDFLIYGLDKAWYLAHPEIMEMKKSEELSLMMESGALVIQAHPFREASYIDHIRLFPRQVHGVEVCNAYRTELENAMAKQYAQSYGLLEFAGTDNHWAGDAKALAGIYTETPLQSEQDLIKQVLGRETKIFSQKLK